MTDRKLYAIGLVATGLVAGLVLAGLNVATAQSSPSPSPGADSIGPDHGPGDGRPVGKHGLRGLKGMRGMDGALHGEFTTNAPGGGYQVMAVQRGDVTAVSATSVTVKSEDGFSRTYVVNDDTLVNAGNDGIADVKTGDKVHVTAVVKNGTASAVDVMDLANVRELRGKWRPQRPRPSASASPSAT